MIVVDRVPYLHSIHHDHGTLGVGPAWPTAVCRKERSRQQGNAAIRQGTAAFEEPNSGAIVDREQCRPWASTAVWAPSRAAKDPRDMP
jgi:hypothetical protein